MDYSFVLAQTLDNGLTTPSSVGTFFDGVLMLVIFLFVVFLAYYSTKLISKAKGGMRKGSNLVSIEAIGVGMQATLQLVKVGEQVFLIGVTRDKISLISEIDPSSLNLPNAEARAITLHKLPKTFEQYLDKHFNKTKDEPEQKPETK